MKQGRKAAVGCAVALLLLAAGGYLYIRHLKGDAVTEQNGAVPPGTLTGIMYSDSGGMTVRNDFFIWLSPEAIVETFYYPEEPPKGVGWHDRFEKENVPISAEQWTDVEQVVLELYPLMKPNPERKSSLWSSLGHWFGAVDGNDSSSITLIWNTEEGEQQIRYSHPHDDRMFTLTTLLKELADPSE